MRITTSLTALGVLAPPDPTPDPTPQAPPTPAPKKATAKTDWAAAPETEEQP
jgi:hypothetical protein